MTTKPVFPEADYYGCNDPEELSYETPEEAVTYCIDEGDAPVLEAVSRGLDVACYRRRKVSDEDIKRLAARAFDTLCEGFSEDFGNPEGESGEEFPADADAVMEAAVRFILARTRPWRCEKIATVALSADQVEEMMRAENPHWFEETR